MSKRNSKSTATDRTIGSALLTPRAIEIILIALITLGGIALRVWQPDHMAVEHFDEGVYASNLFCEFSGNAYPFRHLYAPPLLPALLEWALVLSGVAASSVMWVNVVAGCLMVPSVWWVSRAWFGALVGLTAAALAALSPIHIQYSRAALTDGLLCLWMLWGVYCAWRAILTGRPTSILLAGLFACLAWWTKYNGWLTLAISGAGLAAWLLVPRILPERFAAHLKCAAKPSHNGDIASPDHDDPGTQSAFRAIAIWGLVALIAGVGWMPVPAGLQDVGGYGKVSANHAKYFVGLGGWADSFSRQLANLAHYYDGLTFAAMLTAVLAMAILKPLNKSSLATVEARTLAGWMLAAWFIGLFVAIPLYTAYPRLTLPWVVAAWMVAASIFARLLAVVPATKEAKSVSAFSWGPAVVLLVIAFLTQGVANHRNHVTADRRGMHIIAGHVLDRIESDGDPLHRDEVILVRVVGEPGLFFHLAANASQRGFFAGRAVVVPAADYGLGSAHAAENLRTYVVAGPHAPPLSEVPAGARDRLIAIDEWDYRPSDLVLLDEVGPRALDDRALLPAQLVRLYGVNR